MGKRKQVDYLWTFLNDMRFNLAMRSEDIKTSRSDQIIINMWLDECENQINNLHENWVIKPDHYALLQIVTVLLNKVRGEHNMNVKISL